MKTVRIHEIDNGWLCQFEEEDDRPYREVAFRSYEELESWLGEFLLATVKKEPSYTNISNGLPMQNYKP
jgi:hypothetical protein